MLNIKNLSRQYNIDYIHLSDNEIYEETFRNLINENLIFHSKEVFLKQLKISYRTISSYVMPGIGDTVNLFIGVLNYYHLEKLEEIVEKYSYRVAKIDEIGRIIILRPENDRQEKYTNWYIHLSPKDNLSKIGIKTKSSSLKGFEKYSKRIYLYSFFSLIRNDSLDVYETIKDRAEEIVEIFRNTRNEQKTYYIYAVNLPKKFSIYKDHAQSKDYAVYVLTGVP